MSRPRPCTDTGTDTETGTDTDTDTRPGGRRRPSCFRHAPSFQLRGISPHPPGTFAAHLRGMHGPRERLARLGAAALSDSELLTVLLGICRAGEDGTLLAARLLHQTGGLWALARMSTAQLGRLAGIGPAKASRLAAAFEAGSRGLVSPLTAAAPLSNSEAVFLGYGRRLMSSPVEHFLVICVDAKNRARAEREIARGGRATCQVDPAEVFRLLVAESASGAIFIHNHPSGDPEPSPQDLELTERLVAAGSLLDIRILDHIIVGSGRYTSLRDAGLWPSNAVKSNRSVAFAE